MIVYGMRGCISTKPGGTAEAGLIAFVPVKFTEARAFFIPKNKINLPNKLNKSNKLNKLNKFKLAKQGKNDKQA